METNPNSATKIGQWLSESLTVKMLVIFGLIILLMIPTLLLLNLVQERKVRQQEVIDEIGNSWSGAQIIYGPVLVLPYKTLVKVRAGEADILEERTAQAYVLPEQVDFVATTQTETLARGIFKAAVYTTDVQGRGKFGRIDFSKLDIDPSQIILDKVRVLVGLGDLKGIQENPGFQFGPSDFKTEAGNAEMNLFANNLVFEGELESLDWSEIPFNFDLKLKGSQNLEFAHVAKNTTVKIEGNWASPKFSGDFLPQSRQIGSDHYSAEWNVLQFSRNIPQQWTSQQADLDMGDTGRLKVEFLQTADHYQKTERSIKYAVLIIALTFVALFFTEIITKKTIPTIQYLLVGAAMVVFYSLLLSLSEQIHFNLAYAIAAVATTILIGSFVATLIKNIKVALIFTGILAVYYTFIFVTLQSEDYALLMGSAGLFVTVALLMYFSSRINWNKGV